MVHLFQNMQHTGHSSLCFELTICSIFNLQVFSYPQPSLEGDCDYNAAHPLLLRGPEMDLQSAHEGM